MHAQTNPLAVHLTNVQGKGAVGLVRSLLPALEKVTFVSDIYLPQIGELSTYEVAGRATRTHKYRRLLPNALSRALECTLFARRLSRDAGLLVLGDIPLRFDGFQAVLIHNRNLLRDVTVNKLSTRLKFHVARKLFEWNAKYADVFLVQSKGIRDLLNERYPATTGRTNVVSIPPPNWLLESGLRRTAPVTHRTKALKLFYPASPYPHKNHALLSRIKRSDHWPVAELVLTVRKSEIGRIEADWVKCAGPQSAEQVLRRYMATDALLFLSKEESYGLPLVEAMYIGIPIVAPDLPYARLLCGDQVIFFDPDCARSLHAAISELGERLARGWWPDWRSQCQRIPKSWEDVARNVVSTMMARASITSS